LGFMPDAKNIKIAEKDFNLAIELVDKMITLRGDELRRGGAC